MKIDIANLLNGIEKSLSIDYTLNLDDLSYGTYNPIKDGAKVSGKVYGKANVVYLEADVSFKFCGFCDRCAEEVNRDMSFPLNKIIVSELANDDDDNEDYIVVQDAVLDLDEIIREEVQLFLPSKILCKDDCKGLCFKCGKSLNLGECSCKKEVDPRLAALLELLDEE